MHLRKSKLNEI